MTTSTDTSPTGPPPVPWPVTAVVLAAAGALTAATLWGILTSADGDPLAVLDVAVGVLSVALIPFLWRRPAESGIALAVLAALSGAATPSSTIATLNVARWRSIRTALPVAVAGFLGHAIQGLWRPIPLDYGWWLLCDAAVYAALLGWGAYWQARSALHLSWLDRVRRAEEDQAHRIAEARVAERARIAREMHDTLAHRLSLLATVAGALEYRPDAPPEQLANAASVVRTNASAALEDLRGVITLLRADPDLLGPQPTLQDVPALIEQCRASGLDIEYERRGEQTVTGPVALAIYRTCQEGLTNVRRHAPGSRARVVVDTTSPEIVVEVSDDGARPGARLAAQAAVGLAAAGSGTGLVGLAERVELLGGRMAAGPTGHGFRLRVSLPWDS